MSTSLSIPASWLSRVVCAWLVLMVATGTALAQHAAHPGGGKARLQLATGAAYAPDGRLWVVGLDAEQRLFVRSTAAAQAKGAVAWSNPVVLDTGGDAISADGENRPKLAFGPNGAVVISYTQPLAKPYTGMIRMLRSSDGGQSFSAPFTVHADRQVITHRFESIAFDPKGHLHTLWIDKRDMELAPKTGKKSAYTGAAVYRNVSTDGGRTFGPDIKLADHSCECCRIALTPGPDGVMRALWRHVFDEHVRDHAFASLASAPATEVVRASFDDWHIDACPHHGPGLALATDEGYHAVWFGIRKEGGRDVAAVRYARLSPDGSPRAETVRPLPDEGAEHADVVAWGERVAIVWRSLEGRQSVLKAWQSNDGGRTFTMQVLSRASGDNDHPRLVQQGPRMSVVWRNAQEIEVHDIRF